MKTTKNLPAANVGGFIRLSVCCLVLLLGVFESRAQDPKERGSAEREPAATRPTARPSVRPGAQPTARPAGSGQVSDSEVVDATRAAADKAARATARARGEITFDDLKFDIEPDAPYDGSMLTDDIRELDGKVVKLRGYILPSTLFRETNIDEFVLVRDNQECCFGPGAALFDCVVVNLVGGVRTDFTTRPVTVTGKFQLKEYKYPDDSGHFAIFNLQGTAVK
ncbi:MAG: DUF3299 domain-containing protein [Planctomycetaceae bacterium]|nr:MAG: DUF3299 domain-containing protein [Planctomycetaceae bacterium]